MLLHARCASSLVRHRALALAAAAATARGEHHRGGGRDVAGHSGRVLLGPTHPHRRGVDRRAYASSTPPAADGDARAPSPQPAGPKPPRPPGEKKVGKSRLDELTMRAHPEHSRTVVQSWIAQGKVLVDDRPVTKAGTKLRDDVHIRITATPSKYVCRGGLKLERALEHFEMDVRGLVILDAGLSTGGFADCALQAGAARVYGVDVGYGQVAERIRVDPRVVVMERTNLRHLQPLPELVDVATLDLSFISVLKVLPAVAAATKPGGTLVVLIKPQFEATRAQIGSKGVVRDASVHEEVIEKVVTGASELGWRYEGHTTSPIKGAKEGNTEFLAKFTRDDKPMPWPPPPPNKVKVKDDAR